MVVFFFLFVVVFFLVNFQNKTGKEILIFLARINDDETKIDI